MSLSISQIKTNHLDLNKVKSIEKNRLIAFMNQFIISFLHQCNEFNYTVDSRLMDINRKLNTCESNLIILESKLTSVSGLSGNSNIASTSHANSTVNETDNISADIPVDEINNSSDGN